MGGFFVWVPQTYPMSEEAKLAMVVKALTNFKQDPNPQGESDKK
ncbi:MAG: hypothetical protein OXC40_03920 [Proteobacteria bacterium]|nr:hypothetical protein [Pseudomonadota bacterium]